MQTEYQYAVCNEYLWLMCYFHGSSHHFLLATLMKVATILFSSKTLFKITTMCQRITWKVWTQAWLKQSPTVVTELWVLSYHSLLVVLWIHILAWLYGRGSIVSYPLALSLPMWFILTNGMWVLVDLKGACTSAISIKTFQNEIYGTDLTGPEAKSPFQPNPAQICQTLIHPQTCENENQWFVLSSSTKLLWHDLFFWAIPNYCG